MDPSVAKFFGDCYPTVEYSLSTTSGSKISTLGMVVTGLEARGVSETKVLKLPPAYTNSCIPDNVDEVATPSDLRKLKNKVKFASNFLELDVKARQLVLIGRDCGEALKTTCYGNEAPFIHKTPLGWAAVGETCKAFHRKGELKTFKTTIDHEHFTLQPEFRKPELTEETLIKRNVFQEFADDNISALSEEEQQFMHKIDKSITIDEMGNCLLYTSPSPRDKRQSRMPSSA